MNSPLRVMIVDDEAPARQRLRDLLHGLPDVRIVGEATDGPAAVSAIRAERPDVVFLDVQMPEVDGLEVVGRVGVEHMPLTVFVTAYDRHALRAFDANAVDYLLKPFGDERFEATMERVRERARSRDALAWSARLARALADRGDDAALDRLVIKSNGVTRLLPVAEIDWIESAGMYVNLHAGGREHLYRAPLSELVKRLGTVRFVRIHRGIVVNVDRIARLEPVSHGEFVVVLVCGTELKLSRSYRGELERRLGQSL